MEPLRESPAPALGSLGEVLRVSQSAGAMVPGLVGLTAYSLLSAQSLGQGLAHRAQGMCVNE